jgi:hypothetical protein
MCLGLLVFLLPLCKAIHVQRVAKAHQEKIEASFRPSRRTANRVQIKAFLLLFGVLLISYLPFIVFYSHPRTRKTQTIAVIFIDLVGMWHFIGMLLSRWKKHKGASSTFWTSSVKAWFKCEGLVAGRGALVVGPHSFSIAPRKSVKFLHISSDPLPHFGSCSSEMEEEDGLIKGDIEQSTQGTLIRWTKRPTRDLPNSVQLVGLPLNKFQLFVGMKLESFFPPGTLTPLHFGFCLPLAISLQDDALQKLQLSAIDRFEDAYLHWQTLHEDRAASERLSLIHQFERAQADWAYEDAGLKLKATIEVLLRWRTSSPPSELVPATAVEDSLFCANKTIPEAMALIAETTASESRTADHKGRQKSRESISLDSFADQFRVEDFTSFHVGVTSRTTAE